MTNTDIHDDREYKASIRREWTGAAAGWDKWFATHEAPNAGQALTRVLLAEAAVAPGDAVLDFGSGYGEPGLSAAAAVGTNGHVACLDIAGDMLAFAESRARTAGLANVAFIEGDIEQVELSEATFDVVVSRAALMYATDPLRVLRRLRDALRPGGRLAVGVWATPDKVAFATPVGVIVDRLGIAPPNDGPGPFALGGDGVLSGLVEAAGFADIRSGTTTVVYETPTRATCTEWIREVAPPITELIADQPTAVQNEIWEAVTAAWAPFETADGAVQLPCTAVWAAGRK